MKQYYQKKKCKICGREFYVIKQNQSYHRRGSNVRSRTSKTCSKECSKLYSRRMSDRKRSRILQ